MTGLFSLTARNIKLYFKDKGLFFSSLITPMILLVLYGTFLKNVFTDSFRSALAAAGAAEMGLWATADIPCPYALFERVRGEVTALGGTVDEAEYGADIRLRVSLPAQTAETLRARLTELSAGGIRMAVRSAEFRPGPRQEL